MFKAEKIYRSIALIPRNKVAETISLLQKKKICQIKEAENDLSPIKLQEDEQRVLNLYSRLEFVRENLEDYSNKKPPNVLKELFSSKRLPEPKRETLPKEKLFSKTEECLDLVEENVLKNIKEIEKIQEKRNYNAYLISNLGYLPDINTSLLKDSENLKKIIGIVHNSALERIKKKIQKTCILTIKPIDKKISLLIITTLHKDSEQIEQFLHSIGLDAINIPFEDLKPIQIITRLKDENINLMHEEHQILEELHKIYIAYHSLLEYFHNELEKLKQKIEAIALMKSSESFAVIESWLPEKNIEKFRDVLETQAKGYYVSCDERDDAPTLLNNPKIIKPFEAITELYSLPRYRDIDPTPILAITFSLFFGFMLTDFVYGIILLALGLLLIRGKGSYDQKIKNIGIIMSMWGVFTLGLGIIFGSYFGDFFQRLGIAMPMLIDTMKQVIIVLTIALVMGTTHMLVGLSIGFIGNIKKLKPMVAIHKQGVWIIFIASLVAFILNVRLVGLILLGISVLTQVILTFKEGGLVLSILSLFNFTGFLGDIFSYGRLMALAIGTTGIALAVNFMAIMVWEMPYVGPIIAVFVFVIGHVVNMLMNGLGAFVHSIRLHFLEFFQKFYEGSGKRYIPFGIK